MATTYYEDTASSDLNKNTVSAPANSTKLLQTAAGSGSSLTITLPSSGTSLDHFFIAEPNDPSSGGGTGSQSYSAKLNVTTANMNLTLPGVFVARLNSAGVQQSSAQIAANVDVTTTGVRTIGPASANLGTFAAGDRFALQLRFTNGQMSTQSCVLEVGLANGNEEVTAPWTISSGSTTNQALTATVATSPTFTLQTGKRVTANVATVPSFVRQIAKSVTASVATVPSVVKRATKTLIATVANSASMLAQRVFLRAITATVGTAASATRQTQKLVTASVATVPSITKRVAKAIGASVATAPTLLAPKTIQRALTASATTSASIVRQAGKTLSASVTTAPTMVRRVGKNVTASVATVPSITRQTAKTLTAAVATAPSIVKRVGKTLSVTVTTTASIARSFISGGGTTFNQALTATVGTTASITRTLTRAVALSATVGTVASVTKRIGKSISAVVGAAVNLASSFIAGGAPEIDPYPELITFREFAHVRQSERTPIGFTEPVGLIRSTEPTISFTETN